MKKTTFFAIAICSLSIPLASCDDTASRDPVVITEGVEDVEGQDPVVLPTAPVETGGDPAEMELPVEQVKNGSDPQ